MCKFNRLSGLLTLTAAVLSGLAGTASAQSLTFAPIIVNVSIAGPGATGSANVSVGANLGVVVNSLFISTINTNSGGNWLSLAPGSVSGNQFTLNVGNTTNLNINQQYSGAVTVVAQTTAGQLSGLLSVNLLVGNQASSGGGALLPSPATVTFTENVAGQATPSSQIVSVTLNGALIPVLTANFVSVPAGLNNFLNYHLLPNGTVAISVNSVVSAPGTYQGSLTLATNSGTAVLPITLCFGSVSCTATSGGGPAPNGLSVSPSSTLTYNVQTGGSTPSQNVSILYNGNPIAISGVAASLGESFILPSFQSGNIVNVAVNSQGLSPGMYSGSVIVTTSVGQVTIQVNLTVGGAPTLTVSTTSLNFAYQAGASSPPAQTISVTSNGTAVTFAAAVTTNTGGSGWLAVSPVNTQATPGTVTVTVQPSQLAPGQTYTGNIQINTFGGATNATINIPVSLLVSVNPIITTAPNALTFTAPAGGAAPAQMVQIMSSGAVLPYQVTAAVTSPSGGSWLQVPSQQGVTPGSFTVSISPQGLAPGTYAGTVIVTAPTAGNGSVSIPVTLNVTAGASLLLSIGALNFAYQIGQSQPQAQSINVSSITGAAPYSVTAQTSTGLPWLTVSPPSGPTPSNFVVSVNAVGLATGPYSGTITVVGNGNNNGLAQTIPVNLVVSGTALLVSSPGSLTFTVAQGSSTSATQNLAFSSTDGSAVTFLVSANTNTLANWLQLSTANGTTPATLGVSVNPVGLSAGTYTGSLIVTATNPANVANSPQTVSVTLNVTPTSSLAVSSTSLTFTQAAGGVAPAPQTINVSTIGPTVAPIAFNTNVTYTSGTNWLTVSPVNGATPATLNVSVNAAGLAAGNYTASIGIASPGSLNLQAVNVSLTVTNAASINLTPTSLAGFSYLSGGATPTPQTIAVAVASGAATPFSVSYTTATGGGWLVATPPTGTAPANVTVSVNGTVAATLPSGTYQGQISIAVAGASNSPVVVPVVLTVTASGVITPVVSTVENAASALPTAVSPGLNILILGTNIGPGQKTASVTSASGILPSNVAGTQVTFDSIPAPIVYTSNTAVSVMVPYEIGNRVTTSMVVSYNGVGSTPLQLRVVPSAPGVYTLNGSGAGQGAILNQNGSVNSVINPESAGNFIRIFVTGEGATSPPGTDGAINPGVQTSPQPVLVVGATIGGIPVPSTAIAYAVEAPGAVAGVMMVDVQIPLGVGPGPVPVVVIVGGTPSQSGVIVSVK